MQPTVPRPCRSLVAPTMSVNVCIIGIFRGFVNAAREQACFPPSSLSLLRKCVHRAGNTPAPCTYRIHRKHIILTFSVIGGTTKSLSRKLKGLFLDLSAAGVLSGRCRNVSALKHQPTIRLCALRSRTCEARQDLSATPAGLSYQVRESSHPLIVLSANACTQGIGERIAQPK